MDSDAGLFCCAIQQSFGTLGVWTWRFGLFVEDVPSLEVTLDAY